MVRFLVIVLPLLVALTGLFGFVLESIDSQPAKGQLARPGLDRPDGVPLGVAAAGWLVESLALTALFLLIQGRSGRWWMDGVVAGLIAWIFRGPVLVLSVASLSRLGSDPWWRMSIRWLVLYLLCGLTLAVVARRLGVER